MTKPANLLNPKQTLVVARSLKTDTVDVEQSTIDQLLKRVVLRRDAVQSAVDQLTRVVEELKNAR